VTKAKADQTVGIRLELQSLEREQLESLVSAHAVGDILQGTGAVLSGVGAVLAPFGTVLSVIVAAMITKEGVDKLLADLNAARSIRKSKNDERFRKEYLESGSELGYDAWLEERKQKRDYRQWKWFQENGVIARIYDAWGVEKESTEPT